MVWRGILSSCPLRLSVCLSQDGLLSKVRNGKEIEIPFLIKNCLKLWTPEKFSHVLSSVVNLPVKGRVKVAPYSITERRVPELIPVLGSQPARDLNHKPDGRLPLLSARPAVTPATLKRDATNFAAW